MFYVNRQEYMSEDLYAEYKRYGESTDIRKEEVIFTE